MWPSRAMPYELHVSAVVQQGASQAKLVVADSGRVAVVFHVYNRSGLNAVPRRYTVAA
jgi:phospholipase C